MSNWFSGRHLPGRFQVVFPSYAFLECQETAFLNLLCRRASSSDNISRLRVEGCCVVSSLRIMGKKTRNPKRTKSKIGNPKKMDGAKESWGIFGSSLEFQYIFFDWESFHVQVFGDAANV